MCTKLFNSVGSLNVLNAQFQKLPDTSAKNQTGKVSLAVWLPKVLWTGHWMRAVVSSEVMLQS